MGTATTTTTNAFLTWFAEWGQVAYISAQVLFWAAIAVAALIVALQYKRFVSYKVGGARVAAAADANVEPEVEAFVE